MRDLIGNFDQRVQALLTMAPKGVTLAGDLSLTGPKHFYSSYTDEWQKKYTKLSFVVSDPTIHWVRGNVGYARWSEIPKGLLKRVYREAAEIGINYGGIFATVVHKRRSFMSLAREDREFTDAEMLAANDIFTEFVAEFSNKVLLSAEQVVLLDLLSTSMTQSDIATQLGLSVRGVEYRKGKVIEKLEVDCLSAAIRKATRLGILN